MKRRVQPIALLVTAVWLTVGSRPVAAQMQVQLEKNRIYAGTQTLLHVAIAAQVEAWPTVSPVDGLQIQRYGSPGTRVDFFGRRRTTITFRFLITPRRPGTFTIQSVTLEVTGKELKKGPLRLKVIEAPFAFVSSELDESVVVVGEKTTLSVTFQGIRSADKLSVPNIGGLTLTASKEPILTVTRREGMPLSTFDITVRPTRVGRFTLSGITFDGKPAKPVTLQVEKYVVLGGRTDESSLVVGGQTRVVVFVKGLSYDKRVRLVTGSQLESAAISKRYRDPDRPNITVFAFQVTAVEPGDVAIRSIELPDKTKIELPEAIVLSIRQAGEADIFACRAVPRKNDPVVGEPVILDFEILFRGDLLNGALILSEAPVAKRDYITIEPVKNLTYPDWKGLPFALHVGKGQIHALRGTGIVGGRKEQMLRFALKITSLATGDLPLDGMRVVLRVQITETKRTRNTFFSSRQTQRLTRKVEAPPFRVIDPPGVSQPPLYRGAVGKLTLETALDRTTATAMSPMTLTLRIRGQGVNSHLAPPPLDRVAELVRDFDVSPTVSGGDIQNNTIKFTQVVRPRNASVKELPALPLVYYDYQARKYETVYSLPISIQVNPGMLVGASALLVATNGEQPTPAESESPWISDTPDDLSVDLGANYTTLDAMALVEPMRPASIAAALVSGPFVILLAYVGRSLWRHRRPAATRKRTARSIRASLDDLDQSSRFYVELTGALQDYLRLHLDLPPGEVSPARAAETLHQQGADPELLTRLSDLLTRCDAGRFGTSPPSPADRADMLATARGLLDDLDRVIR